MTLQHQTGDKDCKAAGAMSAQLENARMISIITSKSLQDLSDARLRWLPQDALVDAISQELVDNSLDIEEVARKIIPPIDGCGCRRSHCTGGRIIFAALLSLSRPGLVNTFFQDSTEAFCDADLASLSPGADAPNTPNHLAEALNRKLSTEELNRFIHFTWRMRSPFVEDLASQDLAAGQQEILELPANTSLPWIFLGDAKDTYDEATTVQKMVIHPSHRKTDILDGELALKVIYEDVFDANRAKQAYNREVRANRRAPRHDRIVPLLAAFKHREKFHLILPWARGGNLADLFQNYATSTTTKTEEQQVADWYSERWLLAQCLGLADGLAAVHRTTDNPTTSAQIHADIKPENILCFAEGEADHGPFDLKLADFGEAQEVDPETKTIPVKRVPHTKTYRPPEHDTDDILHLNYDVWCLGCVFLELLTWAIAGSEARDKFDQARLDERDERKATTARGNVFADTFFKKVSTRLRHRLEPRISIIHTSKTTDNEDNENAEDGERSPRSVLRRWHRWSLKYTRNTRITAVVKTQVIEHIEFLKRMSGSEKLNQFLNFIESSMLVVDTTKRASSEDVQRFLNNLHQN